MVAVMMIIMMKLTMIIMVLSICETHAMTSVSKPDCYREVRIVERRYGLRVLVRKRQLQ